MVNIYKEDMKMNSNLKKGKTFATGMVRPKTTALFFDKLWVPDVLSATVMQIKSPDFYIPKEISVENPLGELDYIEAIIDNVYKPYGPKTLDIFKKDSQLAQFLQEIEGKLLELYKKKKPILQKDDSSSRLKYRDDHEFQPRDKINILLEKATTINRNRVIKELVQEYKKEGIILTPIYLTPTEYDNYISIEDQQCKAGIEICLDFIPDIVEDKLTWEQVLEFRQDKKTKTKLDRLRRWFNIDLLKKSEEEIKNILGQKLDDYQWALKKHGIQTLVGGSTSIMSFVSGPTLLKLLTDSPLAMLSGGVAIGTGAIAWIAKKLIERTDLKRDHVAYIYEVRKLEKKRKNSC